VFEAKGNRIEDFEMQVFDRWGGIIFESTSIDLGWDGADYSGFPTDNGVYLYHISLYDLNGRIISNRRVNNNLLNVDDLSKGIYFIEVNGVVKKLVKK